MTKIPRQLLELEQWVRWLLVKRGTKSTKVPYTVSGSMASSTDSGTWGTYDHALDKWRVSAESGVGFVFSADDPYCGIDIDGCRNKETGKVTPEAIRIVRLLNSYTEISPSETGLHIFIEGKLKHGGRRRKAGVEIYDRARYFTVTGDHLPGTPLEIHDRQAEIDQLQGQIFGEEGEAAAKPLESRTVLADEDLLALARRSPRFRGMYDRADLTLARNPGDHSSADMGVCDTLAFYTGRDASRMDCMFRQSALMRPKWDEARGDSTYGQNTIHKAIRDCHTVFNSKHRTPPPDPVMAADTPDDFNPTTANSPTRDEGDKPKVADMARLIQKDHVFVSDQSGYVYEYNGKFWDPIKPDLIRSYAMKADAIGASTTRRRNEVADHIIKECLRPTIPWRQIAEHEVPLNNGVLDLRDASTRSHRKQDWLERVVPHDYVVAAECLRWRRALDEWFEGDQDAHLKIMALQEFMGYILMAHARYKKALFLLGKPDSGKSQVLGVMQAMVGPGNYCSIGIDEMDDPRKLAPIKGKLLNHVTELSANAVIADGGFKKLVSTGESIQIDPKYISPESYVPSAKHVIMANDLPRCQDNSRATYNRMLIIGFNHRVSESKVDRNIMDKFNAEMLGIVAWAVTGARRLLENSGYFTDVPESNATVNEYRLSQNDMNEFLSEKCVQDADAIQELDPFRNAYRKWCGQTNMSVQMIGTKLRKAGAKIAIRSAGHDKVRRVLVGHRLVEEVAMWR